MEKQWSIYFGRLQRFLSRDYYHEMNITGQLVQCRWTDGIKIEVWHPPSGEKPTFSQAQGAKYEETSLEGRFGPAWTTHWFRVSVKPTTGDSVYFHWKSEAESMVWTADGRAVHGLSAQDRSDFPLSLVREHENRPILFYVEMACTGLFGNGPGMIDPPDVNRYYQIQECDLRIFNEAALSLYYDLQIIQDMAATFDEGQPMGKRALFIANNIINIFNRPDLGTIGETITKCQKVANEFLRDTHNSTSMTVTAVGNCHIDTAWLWRYDETRRKTARSWSSQLSLLQRHPSYIFAASQMQQLDWLSQDYPELFERIQKEAKGGRFIPIGGSWVEMDGNLPSGESFARQFLYGQKFMQQHFGRISEIFWLPGKVAHSQKLTIAIDTFGYNAQLPQLMSKAGMRYFVTQKLSWNNINRFPHSSFWWEGIDGTRVLAHFPPSNTYTSTATSGDVIRSERDYKDVDRSNNALILYGHGDGGGGPTEEMLCRLEKMQSGPGMPSVQFNTPLSFFHALEAEGGELLRWRGELYFELHRGTYTSQARTKYYNRRCETLLREAEMLSVINGIVSSDLLAMYPASELESLWKTVLLNQFHDVLPGSSIGPVYDDATKLYVHTEYRSSKIRDNAMNALFGNRVSKMKEAPTKEEMGIVFFNTTPYTRGEVLTVPWDGDTGPQPGVLAVTGINGFSMAAFSDVRVPMSSSSTIQDVVGIKRDDAHYIMENKFLRVHIDETGHITDLFDKELDRQVIDPGCKANRFMMYEDLPFYWDAWDVELHHLEKGWCVSDDSSKVDLDIGMEGPLLVSLLRVIRISAESSITQVISLSCLSKRIDFNCRIEWHESHRLLKVEFPVTVHSDVATFECPFGQVTRPTHRNTSWDVARFEVCGHRFADLSEPGYGVALLNDCKYGYSIHDSLIQLSLLRSPKMPDAECDMGTHVMRFALFPHDGNVTTGCVVEEAVKFNAPLLWTSASPSLYDDRWLNNPVMQFAGRDEVPLSIEAIKLAEDGSGDVIIRAYEPRGNHGVATFLVHKLLKVTKLHQCNLLEQPGDMLMQDEMDKWQLEYKPFEIITLRARIELGPDATPLPRSDNSGASYSSFENIA
jgi:alpha-mannosidase